MNDEANPFQDYESITVDEMKDQASSLLDLATEEQQPLRVCMNYGKEFLLFPWMISFLYWLPMISGDTSKTMPSMK